MKILAANYGSIMFLLCSYVGSRIIRSRRPVSRVLSSPKRSNDDEWPFIWGVRYRIPRRDLPGQRRGNPPVEYTTCRPYSVLLPVGFTLPSTLPPTRCALTAPFHPCRVRRHGGLLSVALSLGSPPPAINRHRVSMEPGLSSPRRVSLLPKGSHPTVWTVNKVGRKPFPVKWLWTRQRRWPLRFLDPDHPIHCPERTGAETPSTSL